MRIIEPCKCGSVPDVEKKTGQVPERQGNRHIRPVSWFFVVCTNCGEAGVPAKSSSGNAIHNWNMTRRRERKTNA